MFEQLQQLFDNYPALYAALSGGPLAGGGWRVYRRKRCLTVALLQIQGTHTDEINTMRAERTQLIDSHAKDMQSLRDKHLSEMKAIMKTLLEGFSSNQ